MSDLWKVSTTYAGGEKLYQVYRTLDQNEPDHSGNRRVMCTYTDKETADVVAQQLNENGIGKD